MDIPVLYKDASLIVCVKPAGVDSETGMPALLQAQTGAREALCVHRLDRDVGGVMVYALDRRTAAALSRALASGGFEKEYLAVVHGTMEADAAELRDLLFHDRAKNKSFVVRRARAGVKEAVLDYRVLGTSVDCSLLAVRLHTGRSHQIRVQLASRRHPLLGDAKYGSPRRDCGIALFSRLLGFPHPKSGEAMHFAAPAPDGFPWDMFDTIYYGGKQCDTSK